MKSELRKVKGGLRYRFASFALGFSLLVLLAGCDRKPKTLTFIPNDAVPTGPMYSMDLEPITPLEANRVTHVAVDSVGNLCWVQESEDGHDDMFIMGQDRVPHVTTLTSDRIADVLNKPGATGNIQSIAAAPDAALYFYFSGARGAELVACLGIYSNRTGGIHILAGDNALMSKTGFGLSLGLARGTVISDAGSLWLWLRHIDDSALFHFRYAEIPSSGSVDLARARMRVTEQEHKINLTNPQYQLTPAGNGALFWYDPPDSMLYQINSRGEISVFHSLVGLPVALSAPARNQDGRVMIFAANSVLADIQNLSQIDLPRIRVQKEYPALLMLKDQDVRIIGRKAIAGFPGLSLETLRIHKLIADPQDKAWVAYDISSGLLLRLRIHERPAIATK